MVEWLISEGLLLQIPFFKKLTPIFILILWQPNWFGVPTSLSSMGYGRDGIQMRMNSWQDGVTGTNCPIPPGWNWTYEFQLKDQIGSFFYFPSLGLQRAAGGFGPITVNNRATVPVPFDQPHGDITLFIGDWYTKGHVVRAFFFCVCQCKSS
jgi:FtsP/CotA-like multicopper oxidase with cupredoxin domain